MASNNLETSRFGGRVNADTGMLLTATDIDRIGGMSTQSLLSFLSLLFFDTENGVPLSGFPREELETDHCKVTSTGALSFSVSTGIGFFYNSGASTDEFGPARYLPIVIDAPYTGSLGAHHATLPRIDIVCVAPAWADDQSASRNVKDPGTGVVSSSSINQRRRFSYAIQVVAGTAASSPTAPAVPSGYVEIGRALVPATTGSATWEDTRPVVEFGHYFKGLPRYVCSNFIPLGGAAELEVAANSPAAMNVVVTRGRAVINGVMRHYKARVYPPLTIAAADPTDPRIDLVIARQSGILDVVTGTPDPSPSAPALPAGATRLAAVTVGAGVTTITSGNIQDLRRREPFRGETHLQRRSTTYDRFDKPLIKVDLGGAAISGLHRPLTIILTDLDGNALDAEDGTVEMMAEIRMLNTADVTVGTEYDLTAGDGIYEETYPSTTGGRPDYGLYDDDGSFSPKRLRGPLMAFDIVDPSSSYEISARRRANTLTDTVIVRCWSTSHPSNIAEFSFVWP